jgi:hypothetical protein
MTPEEKSILHADNVMLVFLVVLVVELFYREKDCKLQMSKDRN